MNQLIYFIKKLFGKEQKRLACATVVPGFIKIKPFYDRSDSYWE